MRWPIVRPVESIPPLETINSGKPFRFPIATNDLPLLVTAGGPQ